MKLVEESMFSPQGIVSEPDSKPFQHNDNTLDDAGLMEGSKFLKGEQNGNWFGLKGCEKETDSLPFELNDGDRLLRTPDLHCYISVDSFRDGNKSEVRDSVAPYTVSSSKTELLEDTDLYTDKSVTECELPELIVYYKESHNSDVKDICVDEVSTEKILVENGKEGSVGFYTFSNDKDKDMYLINEKVDIGWPLLDKIKVIEENYCNIDIFKHSALEDTENSDFTKERVNIGLCVLGEFKSSEVNALNGDTFNHLDSQDAENIDSTEEIEFNELPLPDELKSSAENGCGNKDEFDTEDLIQNGETRNDVKDGIESDVSEQKVVPENKLFEQESGIENSICKSFEIDGSEVEQQSILMPNGDTISANRSPDSAAERFNNSSIVDGLFYNSKVESGSITFHFDTSTPAASGRTECPQNVDREPPLETLKVAFGHEGDTSDHLKVSSQVQHDQGESSFGQFSGVMTHSGPIAYSGSLSLRSDSSTTSARSFAFPVLQTEWNSSPVRMTKAERRHFRNHRGWTQIFHCCRF